jgi:hypothetical protein
MTKAELMARLHVFPDDTKLVIEHADFGAGTNLLFDIVNIRRSTETSVVQTEKGAEYQYRPVMILESTGRC